MNTGFAIALRVGVFAGIIISVLYATLRKTSRENQTTFVLGGIIASLIFSLSVQLIFQRVGSSSTETRLEEVIEGFLMLLLAGGLGILMIWLMQLQNRSLILSAAADKQNRMLKFHWGAFSLAFLAIAREGFEVFRALLVIDPNLNYRETVLGVALAIFTAILVGFVLYRSLIDLPFRKFVSVTVFMLILIGAGLLANAVHELNHAKLLPPIIDHLWDTGFAVEDSSIIGGLLSSILGYNQDPSLTEVLAYLGYLVLIGLALGVLKFSGSEQLKRA